MLIMPCVIMAMPKGNDKDFMEALYRKHQRIMYAAARKFVHDSTDADDIVSDACLALIKNKEETLHIANSLSIINK